MVVLWSTLTVLAVFAGGIATATAASPFDGVYRGGQKHSTASDDRCATMDKDNYVLHVQDGQFTLVVEMQTIIVTQSSAAELHVTVKPDGSFYQSATVKSAPHVQPLFAQIKGQITGNKLQADITNPTCAGHLSLTK